MARLYKPYLVLAKTGDGPLNPPVIMGRYGTREAAERKVNTLCSRKGCTDFWVELQDQDED